jgi:hypothetical protein
MVGAPEPPGGPPLMALPDHQLWHLPGACRRRFLVLMVDAPGSPALTPLGGLPSTFLSIDGGCSWITSSDTASQGPRRRCFLAWMVDAPGSPAPAPPGSPQLTFLALMVGAPEPLAPAPPRDSSLTFFSVDGGRSQTSRGPVIDVS